MDDTPPRSPFRFRDVAVPILLAASGFLIGRELRPAPTAQAPVAARTVPSASRNADAVTFPATSPIRSTALPSDHAVTAPSTVSLRAPSAAPLPPATQPVARTYAELAPRARDGDATAAKRLAEDLARCSQTARNDAIVGRYPDPEHPERGIGSELRAMPARTSESCAEITREQSLEAADWMHRAALAGDAEAMLCVALNPVDFRADLLTPEWRSHAQSWREEAPGMAERALLAGLPEAASLLAGMYGGAPAAGQIDMWRGIEGDQPDRAYFYTRIYLEHAAPRMQPNAQAALDRYGVRLDAATRATLDAQARSFAARIAFRPPVLDQLADTSKRSYCRSLRYLAGTSP